MISIVLTMEDIPYLYLALLIVKKPVGFRLLNQINFRKLIPRLLQDHLMGHLQHQTLTLIVQVNSFVDLTRMNANHKNRGDGYSGQSGDGYVI